MHETPSSPGDLSDDSDGFLDQLCESLVDHLPREVFNPREQAVIVSLPILATDLRPGMTPCLATVSIMEYSDFVASFEMGSKEQLYCEKSRATGDALVLVRDAGGNTWFRTLQLIDLTRKAGDA
jgi:hypothetical protein